jgi:hypothetical protein
MSARSLTKVGAVDPTSVEAMVIFQGVVLGQSLGLSKIIAEGDANVIFEALQEKTINRSRYGHPLEDIWVLLQSFPQWKCEYVSREANGVAHKLAKEATTKINREKGTKAGRGRGVQRERRRSS